MYYLSIDTETGGLTKETSLLTAAFVLYDKNLEELDYLNLELIPDDGIYRATPEALNINKINLTELAKNALRYQQGGSVLYKWLFHKAISPKKIVPVGKNIYFDLEKIWDNLLSRKSWESLVSYRTLDVTSVMEYKRIMGELPDTVEGSLQSLLNYLGYKDEVPHTALGDARLTMLALRGLLDTKQLTFPTL